MTRQTLGTREESLRLTRLRFESGGHRVQRVPATETQGRIHTSAATVAIIPIEPGGEAEIAINPADLRVDTFRSSGAGGQHVTSRGHRKLLAERRRDDGKGHVTFHQG